MEKYNDQNIVELKRISKVYDSRGCKTDALKEIDFTSRRGELILLLGPSGSGKTTMLTIVAGFNQPTDGNVYLFAKNINDYNQTELQQLRAEKIGFIFQSFLLIDALTVFENVELVLKFSQRNRYNTKRNALEALDRVGISILAQKFPNELSHGERQRVSIARAFANNADLLIADEPTASLETRQGEEIIRLLHSYASEFKKCVIVASHDLRLKTLADKIHHIENGIIVHSEIPLKVN
jgi:putative ABC transport system ATP-binding protein